MYGTPSPPMRLPRPHDPPPYASPIDMSKQSRGDHRGTTPHRSDTSYKEDETYSPHRHIPHSNQFRDVVNLESRMFIVEQSCIYASQKGNPLFTTTPEEISAFFINIAMGIVNLPALREY